jgi:DNA ligase (NAD+)
LKEYGLKTETDTVENENTNTVLNGLTVCFTGSSNKFKGDDVEKFLEKNGAKCVHGVSKKLNYLITGDKPGSSKIKKAEELGVEIINENDFYNKFNLNNYE